MPSQRHRALWRTLGALSLVALIAGVPTFASEVLKRQAPVPVQPVIAPPAPAQAPVPATEVHPVRSWLPAEIPPLGPAKVAEATPFEATLALIKSGKVMKAFDQARTLSDPIERQTAQWAAIYYGSGDVTYDRVLKFKAEAPDFAAMSTFRSRLEQALTRGSAAPNEIIAAIGGSTPNTLAAQIALAKAYLATGEQERATKLAQTIWMNGRLGKAGEAKVLATLGSLLTAKDHWARTEHLMMEDRATAVERMFPLLSPAQKSLAVARNAVSRNAKNAKTLLDAVDPSMQSDPVYLFSRAERARQFELWDDAIAFLNRGKASDPDPEKWWYERQTLIRKFLSNGDAARAYKAAEGYRDGPEGRLVEARFHAGWIALSFLHDPASAVRHFGEMAKLATLPDSVTQANYWLGRAQSDAGDADAAKVAFSEAAKHGTLYYGMLARSALGLKTVELRDMPITAENETTFDSRPLVQAILLLEKTGNADMAMPLLRTLYPQLKSGGELALAAKLAQSLDAHHLAMTIADTADKRGAPLDFFSFPKDGLPETNLASIDKAAVYAIARQESRFQPDAVSASGARGLMQLMPATAKETAKKLGLPYSQARLTEDPSYNTLLGSNYLASQLKTFSGSLLLAAAAYNAGAGNANKWVTAYGDPRASNVDPVVWVELIPFQETRKYVQRVLGNYLVYRARLGQADMTPTAALRSIAG